MSFIQLYYDMKKKVEIPIKDLSEGRYKIEAVVEFNEKNDIPKSRLIPDEYIYRKEIEFNYPIQK
jgi:hypothetical protein